MISTRLSNTPDIRKNIFGYPASPASPYGFSSSKIMASLEHCWNDTDGKTGLKHKSCERSIYKSSLYFTHNN
jgi:hypothetical protein